MSITTERSRTVTARDLMTSPVEAVPCNMSLRSAACRLVRAQISGAPVVDAEGRCVGVLSASDFVRWAQEGALGVNDAPLPACPYQKKGRLLTGEEAAICILADGSCPWRTTRPAIGGRHTALCLLPGGVCGDWQELTKDLPRSAVRRFMTTDVVTVGPETPLPELARVMVDARVHRLIVVDEAHRPIGIVSSMDIMAAVARAPAPLERQRADAPKHTRRRTARASGGPSGRAFRAGLVGFRSPQRCRNGRPRPKSCGRG
jgi:CBS domain-containing protein